VLVNASTWFRLGTLYELFFFYDRSRRVLVVLVFLSKGKWIGGVYRRMLYGLDLGNGKGVSGGILFLSSFFFSFSPEDSLQTGTRSRLYRLCSR